MNTRFDQYRQVRESGRLARHPFAGQYLPLQALRAIAEPHFKERIAPLQTESGAVFLSESEERYPNIAASCQLALLWTKLAEQTQDAALKRAASRLAGFLLPILREGFLGLWTPEWEYREEEAQISRRLLLREDLPTDLDSFFGLLSHIQIEPSEEATRDEALGYELLRSDNAALALTLKGWQTSAGALRMGQLEIPAFGPHGAPLGEARAFGIGPGGEGWFSAFHSKEVWLRIASAQVSAQEIAFTVDSAGVSSDRPVAFAFFLRADECRIGGRAFKPQSLQRFAGEGESVELISRGTRAALKLERPLQLELIPLAGTDSYWRATFLLAVWLPCYHAKTPLRFIRK